MKFIWHNYLTFSLDNCALETLTETGLTSVTGDGDSKSMKRDGEVFHSVIRLTCLLGVHVMCIRF